jgi:AMMECR1 domain-containing protein
LECGVSLLVNYEEAKAWDDWVVGTHGILISFEADGTSYRATYLPEVASEQGEASAITTEILQRCGEAARHTPSDRRSIAQAARELAGWDQLTALQSLVRKSGFRGECSKALLASISLTRYQSSKSKLAYSDYLRLAPASA